MAVKISRLPEDLRIQPDFDVLHVDFDERGDSLFMRISDGPEIGVAGPESIWFHVDPATRLVRAVTIEHFTSKFLVKHPQFRRMWDERRSEEAGGNTQIFAALTVSAWSE